MKWLTLNPCDYISFADEIFPLQHVILLLQGQKVYFKKKNLYNWNLDDSNQKGGRNWVNESHWVIKVGLEIELKYESWVGDL